MRYTFYHGTDAKALKMSKEQRDIFRNVCNTVVDYYWNYFNEYRKTESENHDRKIDRKSG